MGQISESDPSTSSQLEAVQGDLKDTYAMSKYVPVVIPAYAGNQIVGQVSPRPDKAN